MRHLIFAAVTLLAGLAFTAPAIAAEGTGITIRLETSPRDRDTRFHFDTTETLGATSLVDFTLTDDGTRDSTRRFNGLSAGRYRFLPAEPAGWFLDSVECDGDSDTDIDWNGSRLTVTLVEGEQINCTFYFKGEATPTPTATSTPAPVVTPVPPTPQPTVLCVVNGSIVKLVGTECPVAPTPTLVPATPVPAQVVVSTTVPSISPPRSGSGGLLP